MAQSTSGGATSSSRSYYARVVKRWAWMAILGILLCGGTTLIISKLTHPVYRASALLVVYIGASNQNTTNSLQAVPTFAQLITSPTVLDTVVAQHPGLTLQQLTAMISVKPQPNTQVIEVDVDNGNPQLAMQYANEISQSFAQYSNAQLYGVVQVLPAVKPSEPIKPKPTQDAAIGALVGLCLAIALSLLFEWFEDRLKNFDQIQEIVGAEILTNLPKLLRDRRSQQFIETPMSVERYRLLSASLNAAQAYQPFKLLMITSTLSGEGKSTVAINLASFLARTGKRVLLVDANLRRPVLDSQLHLDNRRGLSTVLQHPPALAEIETYVQKTEIGHDSAGSTGQAQVHITPTFLALPAGPVPPNAAELLQSQHAQQVFEQFKHAPFDFVLFDAPPLFPVADAQILASRISTILMVVDASKTPRRALVRAKRVLRRIHARILGIAINKSTQSDDEEDFEQYLLRSTKHPVVVATQQAKAHESKAQPLQHRPPDAASTSLAGKPSAQPLQQISLPSLTKPSHPGNSSAEWHEEVERISKGFSASTQQR